MTHLVGARLRNFGPFQGEHELALEPGCYGISARHVDDPGRSNGLGKTRFTDALKWALDGKKVAGTATLDELISEGEDDAGVDLEFSDGLFISRTKKRGHSTFLEVQVGGGGKPLLGDEAQASIDAALGIASDDRFSTCWSRQKELDMLTRDSTTSAMLTKMVERWVGPELERLLDAGERVSGWLKEKVKDHDEAVRLLARLEQESKDVDSIRERVGTFQKNYAEDEASYLAGLKAREARAARREVTLKVTERSQLVDEVGELPEPVVVSVREHERSLEEARVAKSEVAREFYTANSELERCRSLVRGEFDGKCPVSPEFACPVRKEINERSEPNRHAFDSAMKRRDDLANVRGAAEQKAAAAASSLARANQEKLQAERVELRREGLTRRVEQLEQQIMEARAAGIEPLDDAVGEPVLRMPDKEPLVRATAACEAAELAARRLPEARELVERTASTLRAHRLAAQLLGTTGARRAMIKSVVDGVEVDANHRLHESGVPLRVKAAWGRDTKDLADQCPACGQAFPRSARVKQCERCGTPRGAKVEDDFCWRLSWVSGAGLDLGGLGLRIAGYRYLKLRRGASWSIAVLDEPTAQMDQTMRRAVASGIKKLLVGTFEQSFITAHDSSTLESCDRRILITGSGAEPVRSKIEVA